MHLVLFIILIFLPSVLILTIIIVLFSNFVADPGTNWWDQRLYSVWHRFNASSLGISFILENYSNFGFLIGIGSGRSYEFSERVLHSFYTQTLIDHGIIFVFLIIFFYTRQFLKLGLHFRFIVFVSIISISFDPYVGFYVPMFLFLYRNTKLKIFSLQKT